MPLARVKGRRKPLAAGGLAPAGARQPPTSFNEFSPENSLKQSAQLHMSPTVHLDQPEPQHLSCQMPHSTPPSFRLLIWGRLCSLMHRQNASCARPRLCGQAVHNHACIYAKPGNWRMLSIHRKVIHRVWTLWMIPSPKTTAAPLVPDRLHKHRLLCKADPSAAPPSAPFGARAETAPQGCGRFGVFIHMLSKRQNAGFIRV